MKTRKSEDGKFAVYSGVLPSEKSEDIKSVFDWGMLNIAVNIVYNRS